MSAWIVSDRHIDAILTFLYRTACNSQHSAYISVRGYYLTYQDDLTKLGQLLVNQNRASVNYRYNKKDEPTIYKFRIETEFTKPAQIIKIINCYDYQACETPEYDDSEVAKLTRKIKGEAMRQILEGMADYKNTPWGIDPR